MAPAEDDEALLFHPRRGFNNRSSGNRERAVIEKEARSRNETRLKDEGITVQKRASHPEGEPTNRLYLQLRTGIL